MEETPKSANAVEIVMAALAKEFGLTDLDAETDIGMVIMWVPERDDYDIEGDPERIRTAAAAAVKLTAAGEIPTVPPTKPPTG